MTDPFLLFTDKVSAALRHPQLTLTGKSSGLLSFAMYYILKNPRIYYQLQEEVDNVLGGEPIRREHLGKLPYVVGMSLTRCFRYIMSHRTGSNHARVAASDSYR